MPVIDLSAPARAASHPRTTNQRRLAALAVLALGCLGGEPVGPPHLAPEVRCESCQESIAGEVDPATSPAEGASPMASASAPVVIVLDGLTGRVVSVHWWRGPKLVVQTGDFDLLAIVRMDGERQRGRWTVLGPGEPVGGEVRWDGDDMDAGLPRVLATLEERVPGLLD